jgi:hypothetical protein
LSADHPYGALEIFTKTSLGYLFEGYTVLLFIVSVIAVKKASVCPKIMELHRYHRHRFAFAVTLLMFKHSYTACFEKQIVTLFALTGFVIDLENLYTSSGM